MPAMSNLDALLARASQQHGLFTRAQADSFEVDKRMIARRVARGEWRLVTSRVIAVHGAPLTDLQLVMAAVLDAGRGAIASHQTAAAFWDLSGFSLTPPHVIEPRRARSVRASLGTVHTTTWLRREHWTSLHGIPLTTPTRTLFDLSGQVSPARLERAIDRAWSRRLTSGRLLHEMLDDLARRGRRRIRTMRLLLEPRGLDYRPPESGLEVRFQEIAIRSGRHYERQVDMSDETGWLARVDFRSLVLPLVVEIYGDVFHRALVDQRHDRARRLRLEAAGLVVVEIAEFDVWHNPARVIAQLEEGETRARALRRSA
jgi:very-short-patch-repair endonuclease